MLESTIENAVCEFAVKRGWLVRKLKYIGRRGAHDRLFIGEGRVLFVEFKRPGGKPDPHQEREHKRFDVRGVQTYVIDNIEDGKALFLGER